MKQLKLTTYRVEEINKKEVKEINGGSRLSVWAGAAYELLNALPLMMAVAIVGFGDGWAEGSR
jgi:hypothetical protein